MKENDNGKIICDVCERPVGTIHNIKALEVEVNVPTDHIITNKITCIGCKTEYRQTPPDTTTPCKKCGSTNFEVMPNYKYEFEVGDGRQAVVCYDCAKRIVESISYQAESKPSFVSAMYDILDKTKKDFFSTHSKTKSLAQRQTEALEQILTIVKQKELITK